jgi:O-antigen/teichoic acid export membrane protein
MPTSSAAMSRRGPGAASPRDIALVDADAGIPGSDLPGVPAGSALPGVDGGPPASGAPTTAKAMIRGSSLMLVGRAIAMGVNFIVQVMIVRYLTKTDYGAFAYALALVDLGQTVATFGLDRTATRFLSIDDEHQRYDRLFGTLIFVVSAVLGLGLAVVLVVDGVQAMLPGGLIGDAQASTLLVILIILAPIQALDSILTGVLSVFASPGSIFIRRFVLAPGLKLAVVALLVLGGAGVDFLASGYVVAGLIGIVVYVVLLGRLFWVRGLWARLRIRSLDIPIREILLFTIPLLTTDLVYIVLNASDAILLGLFRGTTDVAAFRVIVPAAGLNLLVFSSFTLLAVPAAARLFARNDREGVRDLYWQTAVWMAVISFPLFALTFSLAGDVTRVLYGQRYEGSAVYLAMLSFGYYFNTALGFNGLTLRVYGALRPIVLVNIAAVVLNLALNLALIPVLGPLGAAIGTTTTLVVHNILKQVALQMRTGISMFEPRYARVYSVLGVAAVGLLLVVVLIHPVFIVGLTLAGVVSLVVFALTRSELRIGGTFPELRRLPFAHWLFGEEDEPDE